MIEIRTPSRLHFGLLAFNPTMPRQFGGVGVMVQKPDIALRLTPSEDGDFTATGPMAERAVKFARRFVNRALQRGVIDTTPGGAHLRVLRAPRPHTGLGTGTQLAMAVARAVAVWLDRDDLGPDDLAQLVERGQRSAIGAYGFFAGGMIIEGGKQRRDQLSPLLMRHTFADAWRFVLITPHALQGIAGQRESKAFGEMKAIPVQTTAEMCRLVLLGLAPAMLEGDIDGFGEALFQLQQMVGQCFKQAQGGVYADPLLAQMVQHIRGCGVRGVGQSSWGPTLYAVTPDNASAEQLAGDLQKRFKLSPGEINITQADNQGSVIQRRIASARSS